MLVLLHTLKALQEKMNYSKQPTAMKNLLRPIKVLQALVRNATIQWHWITKAPHLYIILGFQKPV